MVLPRRPSPAPSTGTFAARRSWMRYVGLLLPLAGIAAVQVNRWWTEGHHDAARIAVGVFVLYGVALEILTWWSSHESISVNQSEVIVRRPWSGGRSIPRNEVRQVVTIDRDGVLGVYTLFLLDEAGAGLVTIKSSLYDSTVIDSLITALNVPTARNPTLTGSEQKRLYPVAERPGPARTSCFVMLVAIVAALWISVDLSFAIGHG